jgi:H+/gluconate symporter-like permease
MAFCPLALVVDPLGILALSVLFIVAAIALLRLHAFFALMMAAALVGILTAAGQAGPHRFISAIGAATTEFGATAGKIGFPIALAAVIGISLMESGAADKIVRRMIALFGESRPWLCARGAIMSSTCSPSARAVSSPAASSRHRPGRFMWRGRSSSTWG